MFTNANTGKTITFQVKKSKVVCYTWHTDHNIFCYVGSATHSDFNIHIFDFSLFENIDSLVLNIYISTKKRDHEVNNANFIIWEFMLISLC